MTPKAGPLTRTAPHIALFLHSGLKHLKISAPYARDAINQMFTDDIPGWKHLFSTTILLAPHITHVTMLPYWVPRTINYTLSSFLSGLKELQELTIRPQMLTSDVVAALSRSSHLKTVRAPGKQASVNEEEGREGDDNLESFFPAISRSCFPSLQVMTFKANLWDIVHLLQHPQQLPDSSDLRTMPLDISPASRTFPAYRLTELCIYALHDEKSSDVHALFLSLAELCPDIEEIKLIFSPPRSTPPAPPQITGEVPTPNDPDFFVSYTCLEPLLACKRLRVFALQATYPLSLEDEHVEKLAKAWGSLEELSLTPLPYPLPWPYTFRFDPLDRYDYDEDPQREPQLSVPTLAALDALAAHCPKLRTLSLYLHASVCAPPSLSSPTFQNLESLELGFAPSFAAPKYVPNQLPRPLDLSLLLTHLTPAACALVQATQSSNDYYSGNFPRWLVDGPDEDVDYMYDVEGWMSVTIAMWQDVSRSVDVCRGLKGIWEGRVRALEARVRELELVERNSAPHIR